MEKFKNICLGIAAVLLAFAILYGSVGKSQEARQEVYMEGYYDGLYEAQEDMLKDFATVVLANLESISDMAAYDNDFRFMDDAVFRLQDYAAGDYVSPKVLRNACYALCDFYYAIYDFCFDLEEEYQIWYD